MTRALLAPSDKEVKDTRQCEVSGPAFSGILPMLEHQAGYPPLGKAGPERPILKVIMVHGVGTHVPGYAARLSGNLAQALGLTVIAPEPKEFPIEAVPFPGESLGELTVTRHTNTARDREMLFYELTWSPISQPAKDSYAFDDTAVYASKRASLNNAFKQFVNDVAADPLVYTGTGREKIQASVGQTLCWALSTDWQGLPDKQQVCNPDSPAFGSRLDDDDFVFITHSLGSRITTDALQRLAGLMEQEAERHPQIVPLAKAFQERDIKIFMLANQLPLLQSGLEPATVRDAVPDYCLADGGHYQDRMFKRDRSDRVQRPERSAELSDPRFVRARSRRLAPVPQAGQRHHQRRPGQPTCSGSASSRTRSPPTSTTRTTSA